MKPLLRFPALLWEKPAKVWVGVVVWRTVRDMRQANGQSRARYAALTHQYGRKKGQVAQMHFCLSYLDPGTIHHEVSHAALHISRQFDICTEEDEESVVQISEHLFAQVIERLGAEGLT